MERPLAPLAAPALRALIARAYLGADDEGARVGAITLHPHQREAVSRLRALLAAHGGALLADDVGLGKTYVAAALAREAQRPTVIAPAALRAMWRAALAAAGVAAPVLSYEGMSRGVSPGERPDLLILDEAHHVRTPATRRYRRIAELAGGARVLLLSATPIHNRRDDLAALLALFLGARARALPDDEMARLVVRRDRNDITGAPALPVAEQPRWLSVGDDERTVRALIALPPPVPPRDGGDGGALLHWSLVRQWASSRGALLGALRRRLARAAALAAALEAGRHPSRAELAAWCGADGAVQLAFTELLVPPTHDPAPLLHALRAHEQALRALLHRLERAADIDDTRALRLRELRARHAGERIVAFTQYADTALALFRRLRAAPGVAVLTARGALVAGGALSRAEALRRFAPTASNAPEPRATERITFLIATDLLSEGVDLRDASVVVHLDLPWTPARMEQRVGRSRRLGAAHARTAVYALAPPARAEMLLGVERRLRAKLGAAARVLGIAGAILPPLASARTDDAPPPVRAEEHLRAALAAWLPAGEPAPRRGARADDAIPLAGPAGPQRERAVAAAAARAAAAGALVLARDGARPVLLLVRGGRVSPQPAALAEAVLAAGGDDVPVDAERALVALRAAERWLARRVCERDAGLELSLVADARRRALRRIAAITARAPRHHRALVARLAGRARHAVTARYGTGPERVLAELAAAPMPDDAWLRAVGAFGELHAAPAPAAEEGPAPEVLAVLLLVPPPPGDDAATPPGAASFPPPPRAG